MKRREIKRREKKKGKEWEGGEKKSKNNSKYVYGSFSIAHYSVA